MRVRKIYKKSLFVFAFILILFNLCFAQDHTASQIEKAQQDLEMEKALRTEVEKGKKVLIKKIIVKGVTLLTEDQIKEIILSFKNHWLTGSDINLILDSITSAYKQKGYQGQPAKISYQVKKGCLEINVEEIKH